MSAEEEQKQFLAGADPAFTLLMEESEVNLKWMFEIVKACRTRRRFAVLAETPVDMKSILTHQFKIPSGEHALLEDVVQMASVMDAWKAAKKRRGQDC